MEKKSIARLLYTINLSVLVSCLFVGVLVFLMLEEKNNISRQSLQIATEPIYREMPELPHPNPMIPLALTEDGLKGKTLFNENCGMCHMPNDEALIGPGLWQVGKRRSLEWIVKWIHNPMKMVNSGDPYAIEIYTKYNRFPMTAFPALNEKQIKQILAYLDAGM
jgi:hypothetical protein